MYICMYFYIHCFYKSLSRYVRVTVRHILLLLALMFYLVDW